MAKHFDQLMTVGIQMLTVDKTYMEYCTVENLGCNKDKEGHRERHQEGSKGHNREKVRQRG